MSHSPIESQRPRWLTLAAVALTVGSTALPSLAATAPVPTTKDKVNGYPGVLRGGSLFTPDKGGRTGQAGDLAIDFGRTGSGPVYVQDATFLNSAAAADELTFSFWAKKYDIADGSAFWANAPSAGGSRGFQTHVPWSNNNIYFDTAGCCDAPQRINAGIDTFSGYTGDNTWWTDSWHFFVFTKKAGAKQIWIDGVLFLEGADQAPLPTDFTDLYIGSDGAGGGLFHALVDDFAIYGTALSESVINQIKNGTSPSALPASEKLLAYWDFNDAPSEGQFVTISPAPDTSSAAPNLIRIVHIDGSVAWEASSVTLKVDGATVTPTFTRDGTRVTLSYSPQDFFAAQSTHTASLTYPVGGGQTATFDWSFTVAPYTTDKVAKRVGAISGPSYTIDGGGHTGKAGDYAIDFGRVNTGPVYVNDASFLNAATATDELTFAFWQKKYDTGNSSAFWANSPSSNNGQRGFQAHVPWSNNNIYFDTAGCCDGPQRINAGIDTFSGYTGDPTWWNDWHFFVFSKKGGVKQIWIDGLLFLEGTDQAPLPTDFTDLYIGSQTATASLTHGVLDDFAIFGTALSEATIKQLYTGTLPSALPASDELLAYWDFNDIPPGGLFTSISPAPNSTAAVPNLIQVRHQEGSAPWDLTKVSLVVDGAPVSATTTRDGGFTTVKYVPAQLFAPRSKHSATLNYPNPDGTSASFSWEFTVGVYTRDSVASYLGVLEGPAVHSADSGGRSGQAGDYAIDLGRNNARQAVHILDASFLNQASANDEMSVVAWQKLHQVADSALFWGVSPSSSGSSRGFSVHTPWSNNTLYFDTAGCCDGGTQRINASIADFGDYSGDPGWWTNWHHLVFQKKGATKEIWIDGKLFLSGENTNPLPTDFTEAYLGFDPPDNAALRGLIDDVAVYKTALVEADIVKLATGSAPNTLPTTAGLIAYFNFNDPPPPPGPTYAVGLNFGVDQGSSSLAATASAGAPDLVQKNWNNLSGQSGTATTIVADAQGTSEATTINVVWTSNNTWGSTGLGEENNALTGADRTLFTGYLDTGAPTTTSVTITGLGSKLTSSGYDVIVYAQGGVGGRGGGYRILDATSQAVIKDYVKAKSGTNLTSYVEVPVNADGSHGVGNYIVFSGLNASGIIIEGSTAAEVAVGTPARAPINAVQLVTPASSVPASKVSVARSGANVVITFDGTLQAADSVSGPYTDVANATSPHTVAIPATGGAKFWRSKR